MADPYNVLFLCTGNSARSIMAEALLNHLGEGRFRAFSAGSKPTGIVNPLALRALERHGTPLGEPPRSKNWQEFAGHSAPEMHFVITVCDSAAGEVCPAWPGQRTRRTGASVIPPLSKATRRPWPLPALGCNSNVASVVSPH